MQELAAAEGRQPRWQLDAACMLSQIGAVALPPEVAAKLASGRPLDPRERQMVANAGPLSVRLVANIPRLEGVIALLEGMHTRWAQQTHAAVDPDPAQARDAQCLRAVAAYDAHESAGLAPARALEAMRAAVGDYDPQLLDALQALRVGAQRAEVRDCRLRDLAAGMVLAEDVHLPNGVLLASRGYQITAGLLERLDNFGQALKDLRFRVIG